VNTEARQGGIRPIIDHGDETRIRDQPERRGERALERLSYGGWTSWRNVGEVTVKMPVARVGKGNRSPFWTG